MHISGFGVVVCNVRLVTQDAVEFCCVFAEEVYVNFIMVLVSDLNTKIRVLFVHQDSPSCAVLLWNLLNDVAETLEEIISYLFLKEGCQDVGRFV